jgi:hypothetical protein
MKCFFFKGIRIYLSGVVSPSVLRHHLGLKLCTHTTFAPHRVKIVVGFPLRLSFVRCCLQRHLDCLFVLCVVSMVECRVFSVSPPTLVPVCPACILLCAILSGGTLKGPF